MKKTLFILFVCFVNSTHATNYYFSSVSGDDNRSSSQATSSSTPWKSINKLNSFFSSLKPGDAVLFKRDETFYGSIVVNKSGTSGSPITIGAYGSGNRPIITSFVSLSGWNSNSSYNGVYDCDANSALGSQLNMVIVNEVERGMGRYPNATGSNKGYLNFEAHSGTSSITDNDLSTGTNWTGAELVIRPIRWAINRNLITSQSGHTIYYKASYSTTPKDGFGFFIQNSLKTLDQFGEWYYNPSKKILSMYFGSSNPSSYTVKAASIDYLISSISKSYIVFDNITFKGANAQGVHISGGSNNVVQNCDIMFSGTDGVNVSGSNFRLENCTVTNSNNDGVNVASASATVRNNVISNTGYIIGMGQSGNGYNVGLKIGENGLAEYNQILNTGSNAVNFGGNNLTIKNNYIDNFNFVKDDGGGVYTSNHSGNTNVGRKITGNIILNGTGAPEGTNVPPDNILVTSSQGIYLDDDANGVSITNNTIAACNRAIYLHNSQSIILRNNTFYNNVYAQLFMKHDNLGSALKNHTIVSNIFFAKYASQITADFGTIYNDLGSMGRLDSNYYARPIDDNISIYCEKYLYTSNQYKYKLNLQGWKSLYNMDAHSKTSAKKISPYTKSGAATDPDDSIRFVYNASTNTKSFSLNGNYVDVTGSKFSNNITLQPYASAVLIKSDGSSNGIGSAPSVDITSPSSNNTFTAPASITISANASDDDGISKVEFYNGSTLLNTEYAAPYSYTWQDVPAGNYTITARATDITGIQTTSTGVPVSVVNSSSGPSVTLDNPDDNSIYVGPATIDISATANDADGISKVEFFNGSTLLNTQSTAPYNYSWQNVPIGNYTITARATDNNGLQTTSQTASVSVVSASGPIVTLTSPEDNSVYGEPATITITATASDPDGISKVEFFNGSTLLNTQSSAPYTYTWQNVPDGNYIITAKATDNKGVQTTSSEASVSVVTPNGTSVTLIYPEVNSVYNAPASIWMRADVVVGEGATIKKVEFFNGSTLLHTEDTYPYGYLWQKVPVGNYTISVKATDYNGNVATSDPVSVSVVQNNTVTLNGQLEAKNADASVSISPVQKAISGDLSKLSDFKIYPNPAINSINVSFDRLVSSQKANIVIQNVSGIALKNLPVIISGDGINVNISTLPAGTYFISLLTENSSIHKKFIKIK